MDKIKRPVLLPVTMSFRCNEDEKKLAIEGAKKNNMSCSEYIRMLIKTNQH